MWAGKWVKDKKQEGGLPLKWIIRLWVLNVTCCLPGSPAFPGHQAFWEPLVQYGSVLTLPVLVLPWLWPGFLTVFLQWSLQTSAPVLCSEALALHFRLGEGSREPNVPEMPRKWEPWMNSWAYWSTGSLCILTFIISVGCWCSWLMGPGAVHPSLHINYWRGVFPVIYLTAGCDKYP